MFLVTSIIINKKTKLGNFLKIHEARKRIIFNFINSIYKSLFIYFKNYLLKKELFLTLNIFKYSNKI